MKPTVICLALLILMMSLQTQADSSAGYDHIFQETLRRNEAFKIEACKMAQTQAALPEIKDYAAAELKAHPETVDTPAAAAYWRTKLDDLSSLSGPDFDHLFATDMIFDDLSYKGSSTLELHSGHDAQLKSVAQKTMVAAQADLQTLSAINSKLLSK